MAAACTMLGQRHACWKWCKCSCACAAGSGSGTRRVSVTRSNAMAPIGLFMSIGHPIWVWRTIELWYISLKSTQLSLIDQEETFATISRCISIWGITPRAFDYFAIVLKKEQSHNATLTLRLPPRQTAFSCLWPKTPTSQASQLVCRSDDLPVTLAWTDTPAFTHQLVSQQEYGGGLETDSMEC